MGILDAAANLLYKNSVWMGDLLNRIDVSRNTRQYEEMTSDFLASSSIKELKNFLRNYHFTESITSLLNFVVEDLISKASFVVNVKESEGSEIDKELSNEVSKYLQDIRLRDVILKDLNEHIYLGQYSYYLDEVNRKIYKLTKPDEGTIISTGDRIIALIYDESTNDNSYSLSSDSKNIIKSPNLITYFYKKEVIKKISYGELENKESILKELGELDKIKFLPKSISLMEGFVGRSLIDSVIYRIYQMMLREFQIDLLSIKDTLKQEIILANISPNVRDASAVADALTSIESAVNFSDFSFSVSKPEEMLNRIIYYFQHAIKVVPSLQSISSFDTMERDRITEKKERLERERDEIEKNILNNLGIPDELFSGSSNRWETMSRSSRFMTLIDSILNSEIMLVKRVCEDYIRHQKKIQTPYIVEFNISSSNVIINNTMQNQAAILEDKVRGFMNIIREAIAFAKDPNIDSQLVIDYIRSQIAMIDPVASKLIKEKWVEPKDTSGGDSSW